MGCQFKNKCQYYSKEKFLCKNAIKAEHGFHPCTVGQEFLNQILVTDNTQGGQQ